MNKSKTKASSKTQTTLSAFFSKPTQSIKNVNEKPVNNISPDRDVSKSSNLVGETIVFKDVINNKCHNLNILNEISPLKQINALSIVKSPDKSVKTKREEDNRVFISKKFKFPSPEGKVTKKIDETYEDVQDIFFDDVCKDFSTEFENIFWDDCDLPNGSIDAVENLDLSQWQSCVVLDCSNDNFQYILKVKSTNSESIGKCFVKDFWTSTIIEANNIVSVIAIKDENNQFCVTNQGGYIVLWPDNLVSGTEIVNSLFCTRRSVLQDHFKGIDSGNKSMMIGNLVHELFQTCISKKINKNNEIRAESQNILRKSQFLYMLYDIGLTDNEALLEVDKFIPQISKFVETYILRNGHNSNIVDKKSKMWEGTIEKILDIEENIWSPKYGISGRIDVTVQVKIYNRKTNKSNTKIMPFELKTGKASNSSEHRGQVILYTMLMTEVSDENDGLKNDINEGLLLYLRDSITMHEVSATYTERRDLILLRNKLAHYMELWKTSSNNNVILPDPINHHSACEKCPYLTLCSLYLSRTPDVKLSDGHLLMKLKQEAIGHLSSLDIDYFLHWCKLLMIEGKEGSDGNKRKDLWTIPADIREKKGKCLCNMTISSVSVYNSSFEHTFIKNGEYSDLNILSTLLLPEEYVVVSSCKRYAVASGTITNITANSVSVLLNRNLTIRNPHNTKFTLDSFESQFILSYNLTNLSILMDNTDSSNKLRSIIVDKKVPNLNEKISKITIEKVKDILSKLNPIQQCAILKSLTTENYFLIRGMPGTGKTQTLIALVEVFVKLNMSVLITSHTHSAVDNIFLRLKDKQIKLLRLGSSNKIHKQLQFCSENQVLKNSTTTDDLKDIFTNASVVGVTCLGSNHPLLSKRTFDICIIDESTQVLQCSVIRPLLAANKFILVGDPDQLPPVVKSPEARILGFDESLFYRLDKPESSISLTLQYRMNKTITELANRLTYENQLKCANEIVSTATIDIDFTSKSFRNVNKLSIICLSSRIEDSVIFLDTGNTFDKCKDNNLYKFYEDEIDNHKYNNICEAIIISSFIQVLLKASIKKCQIGVIAPYRDQIALLKKVISKHVHKSNISNLGDESDIEINTVDQYQGRDKDIILYSCTKTYSKENAVQDNKENQILDDKRRLTVAVTRAKRKLIVVGDVSTLKTYKPFKRLFEICTSDKPVGKLVSLPEMESANEFSWDKMTDF